VPDSSSILGRTVSHYRILEKIGAGGMGVVYRARDEQLERDVALKVLPPGTLSNDSARRHFRKEALALAKLNHPNIETVYEFGSQEGTDFLVLEYVPGRTLTQKLASGPLLEKEVILLGMQIAAALEEAHERGIIHRDLKPANIAMTTRGQVKVLDFGLAKLLQPEEAVTADCLTETRGAPGTFPYMSPEQLRAEPVDARSDIHAIGAVLYEMATGRRAFPGELFSQVVDAILHQLPVPPRTLNPGITGELERIICKCLDKEPEHRYQSAKELLADLRRLAASSSQNLVPVSLRPKAPGWRKIFSFAGLGIGAALALAIILLKLNIGGFNNLFGRKRPPQIHSIAVLPLANVSADPQEEYFADGVTDALITELAQIGELRVISRTSVMVYKGVKKPLPQIARELEVDAIVEGSVQRSGGKVRINAELIQASSDRLLWAKSYERDLRDILTLQSAIAKAIVNEIEVKVTPQEEARLARAHRVNPEAHEAYLAGRFYWNKQTAEGLTKSIVYFEQAIAKDPDYALAYAGLADSYHALPEQTTVPIGEAFPKARTAALKALQLDDSLAEAYAALAAVKEDYDWDWTGAEELYKRALQLNPGQSGARVSYSNLLLELGRLPEALLQARTAQQLDPLSVNANDNLSSVLYYSGDYDQSIDQSRKTLEIDPMSHKAHRHLGQAYTQKKEYAEAIAELKKAIEFSGGSSEPLAELGYVFGVSGRKDEARRTLQQLLRPGDGYMSYYRLAIVYMGLGEKDKALESLELAVRERSPGVVHLKVSPLFIDLRSTQRFQKLLTEIGLGNANQTTVALPKTGRACFPAPGSRAGTGDATVCHLRWGGESTSCHA
jgi:serine/threonine protein kinase/tetratricopeptide (TPR) repeat protein